MKPSHTQSVLPIAVLPTAPPPVTPHVTLTVSSLKPTPDNPTSLLRMGCSSSKPEEDYDSAGAGLGGAPVDAGDEVRPTPVSISPKTRRAVNKVLQQSLYCTYLSDEFLRGERASSETEPRHDPAASHACCNLPTA